VPIFRRVDSIGDPWMHLPGHPFATTSLLLLRDAVWPSSKLFSGQTWRTRPIAAMFAPASTTLNLTSWTVQCISDHHDLAIALASGLSH